jgi:hypothetical protein
MEDIRANNELDILCLRDLVGQCDRIPFFIIHTCLTGRQSLFSEFLVVHDCSCISLADSVATASFASKCFLQRSGIA